MVFQIVIYSLYLLPVVPAQYAPPPRWAQAVALLESTLYVHGGLSDPFNSYSYTSAPMIPDLLVLDLSTSFDSSSPPWQLFSNNRSPALAWHTLSAFNPAELLLFGGQPNPNSLTVLTTLNDSSGLISTSDESGPSFLMEPQNWANEPVRRIRHSSSYTNGKVWIIGGEKADDSGNAFSEHYTFTTSGPEFVQLPSSTSAPPDIYGHASLVLPDGRLLVLGGYCASCSSLMALNTVWSLNTTQNPLVWEKLFISNSSLPSPRRDFAAVVLPNGQVLIHGGGDAQLQATYSDGWILDTNQNPMVWQSVTALEQLGQRKNHLAVQAGGYVLFCFGYGSSSPASASLFIYNPATSLMVTSYAAPSPDSTPAVTSLPAPTRTGSNPNSNGGTATTSPGGSTSSPSYPSGSSSDPSSRTIAIALGTTFGVLGLVAGGLASIYYVKRVHRRNRAAARTFFPLAGDPETSSGGSMDGAAPEAACLNGQTNEGNENVDNPRAITDILAHLGIGRFSSRPPQPRKDMFADEDARSFGWVGHSSTVQRQGSEGTSLWSLRALVRGVIGREPSGSEIDQGDREWEKTNHLRGVQEGLIRPGSPHNEYYSHPTHREDGSFWSYTDPFKDPLQDDEYDDLALRPGIPEKDADYDNFLPRNDETDNFEWSALGPQDSIWPPSIRSHTLTPPREVSHASLSDPCNSLPSLQEASHGQMSYGHADNAALSPPLSISPTTQHSPVSHFSDPHPFTSAPRSPTVSGSALFHSPSLSRPDSWWSRLTKSPLLDRRASITSSKPLDFRDPAPAPSLVPLEETKKPPSAPAHSNNTLTDIPVAHGKSLSSAYSRRTANTDSAEYLGSSYDVVQRLVSDGSSSRRAPSLGSAEITEQGMFAVDNHALAEISPSSVSPHADPPRSTLASAGPAESVDVETPSESLSPKFNLTSLKGAVVANRVRAYERRLSQELESQQISPVRNTRRREEIPSRTRPTRHYGVAPRASLFVANPDLGHIS